MKKISSLLMVLGLVSVVSATDCNYYQKDSYPHYSQASADFMNFQLCNKKADNTMPTLEWDKLSQAEKDAFRNEDVVYVKK